MAHSKNRFVEKQDETVVEVDVPGKDLKVLIPDNRYAYGDNESVAQMAQDVVGKHSTDEGARGASDDGQRRGSQNQSRSDRRLAWPASGFGTERSGSSGRDRSRSCQPLSPQLRAGDLATYDEIQRSHRSAP